MQPPDLLGDLSSEVCLPLQLYISACTLHARQLLALHLNKVCDNHGGVQTGQGFIMTV